MGNLNVGGTLYPLQASASTPRLKVGSEYIGLTSDSSMSIDRPRLKVNIGGTNYYPQQFAWTTYASKYYNHTHYNDSGGWITVMDSNTDYVKEINFHVWIDYWMRDRYDAQVQVWLYWNGGEAHLWTDHQDGGEDQVHKDLSYTFSTPVNDLRLILKVWAGDPKDNNDNGDDLIYSLDITSIDVLQKIT